MLNDRKVTRIKPFLSLIAVVVAGAAAAQTPIAYWNFDETSGTVAADASGNSHDGSHFGGPVITTDVPPTTFADNIDDVRIYNRAITAVEVADLFAGCE